MGRISETPWNCNTSAEFWAIPAAELQRQSETSAQGLTDEQSRLRLQQCGPNELTVHESAGWLPLFWNQLSSPLLLLLVFAGIASAFVGETADAVVILIILTISTTVGFTREYRAASAAEALKHRLTVKAQVRRGGREQTVSQRDVVPGDLLLLSAGSLVAADAVILECCNFCVSEGLLTGESLAVEKHPGPVAAHAPISERSNCVFQGTSVRSGTATCLVVRTGASTEVASIAHRLNTAPPPTEFDRALQRFSYFVTSFMLIIVLLVFAGNVVLGRPVVETLLFSIALAVGLSPELLPAILSVNLARSTTRMAGRGVLVRHLNAIENLGSMEVLCTDKTGTLTEGVVRLDGAFDWQGQPSQDVLVAGALNAALQTGLENPLDQAILESHPPDLTGFRSIREVPWDFARRRMSVVVEGGGSTRMITKGAFESVLSVCSRVAGNGDLNADVRQQLFDRFEAWSRQGIRVLAVAMRTFDDSSSPGRDAEEAMTFIGVLTFFDRPKPGAREAIQHLRQLGVSIRIITGDVRLVAAHVAEQMGLDADRVLTGKELMQMSSDALLNAVESTELFAEVDPNQKEKIIRALQQRGHVVGFLGDGINDAPAMHVADVGLSVESAADVAREAADFVLLERDLDVIRYGIEEGRTTFINTRKYLLTTMSANLGNMLSMAVASLFLPFLPLLASQVLLNNFLSDIPAIGLAGDTIEPAQIQRPKRWNLRVLGRFMIEFGFLSSLFDVLTFVVLLHVFRASVEQFRTAWFMESLLTELVVVFVVRSRGPFWKGQPGTFLSVSSIVLFLFTLGIPWMPAFRLFGFVSLPVRIVLTIAGICLIYLLSAEYFKRHSALAIAD